MSNQNLSGSQLAAALAEEIYRRNSNNQPINPAVDLAAGNLILPDNIGSNLFRRDSYYYPIIDNGFVGRILQKSVSGVTTYYVVYRGWDWGASLDSNDVDNGAKMGLGSLSSSSQAADALALAQYALDVLAGGDRTRVQVIGQSQGGGLAGFVGGVLDLKGYLFAPAPFAKQFIAQASAQAASENGILSSHIVDAVAATNGSGHARVDAIAAGLSFFGYSASKIGDFSSRAKFLLDLYTLRLQTNGTETHTIQEKKGSAWIFPRIGY